MGKGEAMKVVLLAFLAVAAMFVGTNIAINEGGYAIPGPAADAGTRVE